MTEFLCLGDRWLNMAQVTLIEHPRNAVLAARCVNGMQVTFSAAEAAVVRAWLAQRFEAAPVEVLP